jgi:exopolysaccharide biosynthesis polyprenyl glycosylphosphotransferase
MFKRFSLNFAILSLIIDMGLTFLSMPVATLLRQSQPTANDLGFIIFVPLRVYLVALVILGFVFITLSVYDPRRTLRAVDEFQQVIVALFISALCMAGFVFFAMRDVSRYLLIDFFVINALFLLGWRLAYRVLRRLGHGRLIPPRNVLIVGAGHVGQQTAATILENSWTGYHVIGFLDDDPSKQLQTIHGLNVLSSIDTIAEVVTQHTVKDVVIALPLSAYEKVVGVSLKLQHCPVNVWVVPDYFSIALFRATVEDLGGMPLINLRAPALNEYQRAVKRIFDLVCTTVILLPVLPVMAILAILVKLDSHGPIIFAQQRVGENGHLFWMLKFRTMIDGADSQLKQLIWQNANGQIEYKRTDDPRITRIGHFLRRTSLDELPQLLNVLKGEMSLVGPRPEMPWLVERYEPWQHKRFAVPQGMTGWWQVNGRSDKPMHLHTEDDLYYIQNYSLLLDIQILWKTIWIVIRRKGAF